MFFLEQLKELLCFYKIVHIYIYTLIFIHTYKIIQIYMTNNLSFTMLCVTSEVQLLLFFFLDIFIYLCQCQKIMCII